MQERAQGDLLLEAIGPSGSGAERLDRVRLIRSSRVGATTYRRLMAEHGSAAAALEVLPKIAADAGVERYTPCPPARAQAELDAGHAAGAEPLFFGDPSYPPALTDIPDAPPLLWARGHTDLGARLAVALVGARNASALGRRMAAHLATGLGASEVIVVSGLARGIDAAAHKAALPTGTIAVLAGGIDVPYPEENADLHRLIGQDGLLLSEMPPGLRPQARHFPRRNRIISGLAQAVVVIEGAAKSGSLITARNALDQGREVMAVPGHPFDARASGCNMLLRDGATLVRGAGDVAAALGLRAVPKPQADGVPAVPPKSAPGLDRRILDLLGPSPVSEDVLMRQLDAPAQAVLARLAEMELSAQVARHPGGMISRPA